MSKVLKCDDLLWLQDAPLFKEEVAFKIKQDEYTVKESYQEYKETDKYGFRTVTDSKCYLNNITDYTYSIREEDNVLNSYKGDGPAIFTYMKPFTNSTSHIINREFKSIGYKTSTGDIQNCTKLMTHIVYQKTTGEFERIMNEFFKGNEKDGENPVLNKLVELKFYGYNDYDDIFERAIETRTMFDRDGNIEDYLVSDNKYCRTEMGDLICVDTKVKYSSTGDNDRNIIPKLVMSEDDPSTFTVQYYQKINKAIVLSKERFKINEEDATVRLIESITGFGDGKRTTTFDYNKLDKDGNPEYRSVIRTDSEVCTIIGYTNSPVSADYFTYDKYKNNITVGMNSYFSNIFQVEYLGAAMLTNSYITEATIRDNNLMGNIKCKYTYERNDHGQYISQNYLSDYQKESKELAKTKVSKLPNGHDLVESVILAEPMYPKRVKSIFYQANEVDDKNELISSYSALVVKHKEY